MKIRMPVPAGCLLLLLTACPAPNAPDLLSQYRSNLVAEYLFQNAAIDSSGHGNDGTVTDVIPAFDRFTRAAMACYFDPANTASIDCGNDASLSPPDAISVALWFKANDVNGSGRILSKWDSADPLLGWRMRIDSGQIVVSVNGTSTLTYSTAGLDSSDWVFVVWTLNASEAKLYINGVLLVSNGVLSFINPSSMNLTIGKAAYADLGYFSGCLDNIRIYDTVIPPELVQALYTEGS